MADSRKVCGNDGSDQCQGNSGKAACVASKIGQSGKNSFLSLAFDPIPFGGSDLRCAREIVGMLITGASPPVCV